MVNSPGRRRSEKVGAREADGGLVEYVNLNNVTRNPQG